MQLRGPSLSEYLPVGDSMLGGDRTVFLVAGPESSCPPPTDGGVGAFYPIIGVLGIAAALGWVLLRTLGVVGKNGEGLFGVLKASNPAVRIPALIAVIGLCSAITIGVLVEISLQAYGWVTNATGCATAPEMWTPALVFTIVPVGVLICHFFIRQVPNVAAVSWALFSLAAGFWLSTWGANIFLVVWVPVTLAFLPMAQTKLSGEGRSGARDAGE